MAWISLFLSFSLMAAELPRLLTKHSMDSLRFITMDGRYAYVKKRAGVLGLVSSFRSIDFLSESQTSDFLVTGSKFKTRVVIEVIPNQHQELNPYKLHKILIADWGGTQAKEVGQGINAKLHLLDEWLTFFNPLTKVIHVQNIVTQKKIEIKLSPKTNPFFRPHVELLASDRLVYSDINQQGYAALISMNLLTSQNAILYRSPQKGTELELCQGNSHLAIGEFSYEGVEHGSKIMKVKLTSSSNLAGYESLYTSSASDIGNMVCLGDYLYFIKTLSQTPVTRSKVTEVARIQLETGNVEIRSSEKYITQLFEMDGRVIVPHRGEYLVVEGNANLGTDTLKKTPSKEELPLEL